MRPQKTESSVVSARSVRVNVITVPQVVVLDSQIGHFANNVPKSARDLALLRKHAPSFPPGIRISRSSRI
jgi:hypothetical protein